MRTIEQKVCEFSELSKEVQEKVIEKWYENEEYYFLSDDLYESLCSNVQNIFDRGFKVYYSLSCCQGDGLNIKGDIDLEKTLTLLFPDMKLRLKNRFLNEIKIYSNSRNNHYSFSSESDIDFECYNDFISTDFENNYLPVIQDHYMDLCRDLEREGYSVIEYRMDIEEFTDMSECNEYEYFENGKQF